MEIKGTGLIEDVSVQNNIQYKGIENINCVTGDKDYLIDKLKLSLKKAKRIDIIVAFLMETGVRLLSEDLKKAAERKAPIRILTGNYLNITQPQALYLLKDALGDKVDLRFYNVKNKSFHPKAYMFDYNDLERAENEKEETSNVIPFYEPKGAQIEALYGLKKSREEGMDKGLVVAATGIGKTYLAAFDSVDFHKVLFVAHREEILNQAETTFKNVKSNIKAGFFSGKSKDENCDLILATVQTLGQKQYLCDEYFKKDEFDYIIIDEFHHAAAGNYDNIIKYFTPKFLLGLTATPERLDNKDVFALCDYNIVYEARLKQAIDKGWLVPFRYYGIFDDTDYTKVSFSNGKYHSEELETALMINKRADLILKHFKKYNSRRALGFCSSKRHAEYMSKYFNENGVKASVVISGGQTKFSMDRSEAVYKLKKEELNIIFSVDMFNEGLDIPEIDMILLLRPTESHTIFLQQLGRGLRTYKDKKYVNVLDFIGNYKKAHFIPFFLSGDLNDIRRKVKEGKFPKEDEYPEDCIVDFDFQVIDVFKKMVDEEKNIFDLIVGEFNRIKEDLKARPTRLQMYTYIEEELYNVIRSRNELNIFNDYLGFLNKINELSKEEKLLLDTKAYDFLNSIEKTSMTKTYKMPLLLAFYNRGNITLKIDEEAIFESFRDFYAKPSNAIDLLRHSSTKDHNNFTKKEYLKIAENPIKAFLNSSKDFFYKDNSYFCLKDDLAKFNKNPVFIDNFKDIIDYKTRRFYKERLEKL